MLVLTRKPGQRVMIGDAVVTIKNISPKTVKLSIDAPLSVRILRGEIVGAKPKKEKTNGKKNKRKK